MKALSYLYLVEFMPRKSSRLISRHIEAPTASEAKKIARQRITDELQISPRSIHFLYCTRTEQAA